MKTPAELADSILSSPEELKRRSIQIKRVAGGIRSEISSVNSTGLTKTEMQTLTQAAEVLDALATRYASAEKLARKKRQEHEQREKQVRAAMNANFGALSSIADKIALVGAVQSHCLRAGLVDNLRDLDYQFKDAMQSLSYSLAGKTGKRPDEVVSEAWEKFLAERQRIIDLHKSTILNLEKQHQATAK